MEGKAEILNLHSLFSGLDNRLLCYQDFHFSVLAILCEVCRTRNAVPDPM